MPLPAGVRSFVPLLAGLIVGGVGATLFRESMPGAEGSPEQRAEKLELALKKAQNRLAALEAGDATGNGRTLDAQGRIRPTRRLSDGVRDIARDIREGRLVNPDDVFRASQPLMRDLAPLFDRMRVKQQQQMIDAMTGAISRKYHLTPARCAWTTAISSRWMNSH